MRSVARWWTRVVRRHPRWVLAGTVAVTVVLAGGLARLTFDSSQDTMIPSGSTVSSDNVRYQHQFGSDPMVLVFAGDIQTLLTGENLDRLRRLQDRLEREGHAHAVLGPLTALRFAAAQLSVAPDLATAALARDVAAAMTPEERARIEAAFRDRTASDAARLATVGTRSLDNPAFVQFLVEGADGAIRPSLRGVFPDRHHTLMVVRPGGGLSIDEQGQAADRIVALARASEFEGVRVTTTGTPLLVKEINDRMRGDMAWLGVAAALAMAIVLLLVFRARWRLLSLATMALGTLWAFGAVGYLGIPLTMVTISGLPILIGLGVDFAVQVHSRYEEELDRDPARDVADALDRTFLGLGPAITVAAVAAVVGFLALRVSDVPMIREFGALLSIGVACLFVAALLPMPAMLAQRDVRRPTALRRRSGGLVERATRGLAVAGRRRPATLLAVSVAVVVLGSASFAGAQVQSDPERWVPQDSGVLSDLRALRSVAGSSAELGLMVEARNVLRSDVVRWMWNFERAAVRRYGHRIVSASSAASMASQVTGSAPTEGDVRAVLAVAPPGIRRSFVSGDGTRAQIIFAIGPMSLEQRRRLVDRLVDGIDPPLGVRVTPSGLAVVGTAAVTSLTANREQMTYLALAAVLAWLLVALRSIRRALLAILPVATALALGAVVISVFGITVNVLAAISGPLVIATCTEFTVLILERFLEERRAGQNAGRAVDIATMRIGRAFVASGMTTAAGFGVLAVSGFPLLSGFGVVVAVYVVVALVCALAILPPLLAWTEARVADAGTGRATRAATARHASRKGSTKRSRVHTA